MRLDSRSVHGPSSDSHHARPRQSIPGRALPCHNLPREIEAPKPRPALPSLTMPRIATAMSMPARSAPSLRSPRQQRQIEPCHISPCLSLPRIAHPRQSMTRELIRLAAPRRGSPHLDTPRHATTFFAETHRLRACAKNVATKATDCAMPCQCSPGHSLPGRSPTRDWPTCPFRAKDRIRVVRTTGRRIDHRSAGNRRCRRVVRRATEFRGSRRSRCIPASR